MNTLKAIRDKVIIRRMPNPEMSAGGIVIQTGWEVPPDEGIVVAVGEGRWNTRTGAFMPTNVKVGDRVAFKWMECEQAGRQIKWGDETLHVLDEGQLCGIVEAI